MTAPLRLRRDLPARLLADIDGTTVCLFYTSGARSRWQMSSEASRQLLDSLPESAHVWLEYADGTAVPAVFRRYRNYAAISLVLEDGLTTLQAWWHVA